LYELRRPIFSTQGECLKVILSETPPLWVPRRRRCRWNHARRNINSHPFERGERAHWKISGVEMSPSEREINLRDYYYYFTCSALGWRGIIKI